MLKSIHTPTHRVTGVSGQVEDQAGEEGEEHAGDDDVHDEVQRQSQHQEMIGDVQVRCFGATRIINPVFPAPVVLHHPLTVLHEVTEVWTVAVLHTETHIILKNGKKKKVHVQIQIFLNSTSWYLKKRKKRKIQIVLKGDVFILSEGA